MSRDHDNDFARALASALEEISDESSRDCPGPDTLAAWAENALPEGERAQWSGHFSGCRRCQATLAAFLATEDVLDPSQEDEPSWTERFADLLSGRWLRPLAAVATAGIALSVGLRLFPEAQRETFVAQRKVPEAVAPAEKEALQPLLADRARMPAPLEEPADGASELKAIAPRTEESGKRSSIAKQQDLDQLAPGGELEARAKQAAPSIGLSENGRYRSMAREGADEAAKELPEETASRDASVMANERLQGSDGESFEPTTRGDEGRSPMPTVAPAPQRTFADALFAREATSPWRLGGESRIERSADGGITWEASYIGKRRIMALAPVEPDACWAVGARGLVLRYTAEGGWTVTAPPTATDLVEVTATSPREATVRSEDGRAWSTSDAGQSWNLVGE